MQMPILKKNTNGIFYAHWTEDRRSKRKSMGTRNPVEAQRNFAKWLLLRDQAETSLSADRTVEDCWFVYCAKHIDAGGVASPETAHYNWQMLSAHFGSTAVNKVNQRTVDEYVAKRTSGQLGRKVKPQTCRKELQSLIAALRFCAAPPNAIIPASSVPVISMPAPGAPRDRWLRPDEMRRMMEAAAHLRGGDGDRLSRGERYLWIALEAPARMSAILDLTWDRVHFDIGTIEFGSPDQRETKKRRTTVPMSDNLRAVLCRAYEERISDLVMDNKADMWPTIQRIAVEAGLAEGSGKIKATGISPHTIRHTAATYMARNGVPLWKIAKILGNSLAMVEKVYAKWSPDDPDGTVNLISGGILNAA